MPNPIIDATEWQASALHLEPGDTLVLRAPAEATIEAAMLARSELSTRYPEHTVLVLHGNGWLVNAIGDLNATARAIDAALELNAEWLASEAGHAPLYSDDEKAHLERLAGVLRSMGEANAREAGT